jgi:hypothetical protein
MAGFIGDLTGGILKATGIVKEPPKPAEAPDPYEAQEELNKEEAAAKDRARRARGRSGYATSLLSSGEAGVSGSLLNKKPA